jgi:hypothetical protein
LDVKILCVEEKLFNLILYMHSGKINIILILKLS